MTSCGRKCGALVTAFTAALPGQSNAGDVKPVEYRTEVHTVLKHDNGEFLWFQPRVAALGTWAGDKPPAVILTLQKQFGVPDHFSGLHVMRSADFGRTWTSPEARPELDWTLEPGGIHVCVGDVTPGWHPQTKKLLAIGAQIRYNALGEQLEDKPRSHQTAYTVFDPDTGRWIPWQRLEMPADARFNYARSACCQWLIEADGTLLVPFYISTSVRFPFSAVVARCSFDGNELKHLEHGPILTLDEARGLDEPSLVRFENRYYLTIRNDVRGYVTVSDDGLKFRALKAWAFDDGQELGSYNTQQHWLATRGGLLLIYTRRGADNDHVFRNRAPLFIAQVDPDRLHVIRRTERVLIPERGAGLGNFGATAITEHESWVVTSESYFLNDYGPGYNPKVARSRGAEGAVFIARVIWSDSK